MLRTQRELCKFGSMAERKAMQRKVTIAEQLFLYPAQRAGLAKESPACKHPVGISKVMSRPTTSNSTPCPSSRSALTICRHLAPMGACKRVRWWNGTYDQHMLPEANYDNVSSRVGAPGVCDLGHLQNAVIAEGTPHQQWVLCNFPEVCKQAVHALLAQFLCEPICIRRCLTCLDMHHLSQLH